MSDVLGYPGYVEIGYSDTVLFGSQIHYIIGFVINSTVYSVSYHTISESHNDNQSDMARVCCDR